MALMRFSICLSQWKLTSDPDDSGPARQTAWTLVFDELLGCYLSTVIEVVCIVISLINKEVCLICFYKQTSHVITCSQD